MIQDRKQIAYILGVREKTFLPPRKIGNKLFSCALVSTFDLKLGLPIPDSAIVEAPFDDEYHYEWLREPKWQLKIIKRVRDLLSEKEYVNIKLCKTRLLFEVDRTDNTLGFPLWSMLNKSDEIGDMADFMEAVLMFLYTNEKKPNEVRYATSIKRA